MDADYPRTGVKIARRATGYELAEADAGNFYIRRQGSKVNETADLFGLDLAGIEDWIRKQTKG